MNAEDFENLVTEAGLHLLSKHGGRFLVSLRVITKLPLENGDVVCSVRYICDVISYEPAEFAMLTPEQARSQIELSKARLEKAAKTNHGDVTRYEKTKPKPAKPRTTPKKVAQQKIVNYPAH